MDKENKVTEIINDAASNVACESGNLSVDELNKIREHLMGISNQSDDSFIYGLVKKINEGEGNGRKTK